MFLKISFVIPCYNESSVLPLLYERLKALTCPAGTEFEFIFIDDGSVDSTWEQLSAFARSNENWRAIRLSRNFGHQKALWTAFRQLTGDVVFVLDADLQDPPELLEKFLARYQEGYDVVYGVRTKRKEGLFKRIAYGLFYRVLARVADIDIPLDSGDYCLMDRKVVETMLQSNDPQPFVRGARAWSGFRQTALEYERDARAAGVEKYGFRQLLSLAMNGLFSYSRKPLRAITCSGLGTILLTIVSTLLLIICPFVFATEPFFSIEMTIALCTLGLLSGIQMVGLGIIGEYVGKIHDSVTLRPAAIIDEMLPAETTPASWANPKTDSTAGPSNLLPMMEQASTTPVTPFQDRKAA